MKKIKFSYMLHPKKAMRTLLMRYSDRYAIEKMWLNNFGYPIDLDNPQTLNEKIQWLKLHDHNPIYTTLVDKYKVKQWLIENFGYEYVIPTTAVYYNTKEIDYANLPVQFVLKCNHDSGSVILCENKNQLDWNNVKHKLDDALSKNYFYAGREWCYKHITPRCIIQEPYIKCSNDKVPNDYKFHYINGKLAFIYVSYDRNGINDRCTYNEKWERLPFLWIPKATYRIGMNIADVPCPKSFPLMVKFGEKIASMFRYVRVDFFDVDGKLYFGEITLYHGSGYDYFFPQEYDKYYGNMLKL